MSRQEWLTQQCKEPDEPQAEERPPLRIHVPLKDRKALAREFRKLHDQTVSALKDMSHD